MSQCIESVNGLPSTSTSNTDTWIVTFNDRVNYDHIPIKKGFVKIWLSHDSVKYKLTEILEKNYTNKAKLENEISEHLLDIGGLNYEAKVYRDIVKGLIESNICPNFIKFLGLGQNCSFEDVRKMLVSSLGDEESKDALFRSAVSLIKRRKQRPSINEDASNYRTVFAEYDEIVENTTFTILLNEAVRNNSQSDKAVSFSHISTARFDVTEKWSLLFQLMAAVYAMSLSGLTHNDLHTDNAWIEPCEEKDVSYVYGGQTFNFKTKYVVKVFDFDRSYNKRLGENPYLDESLCDEASQCNKYIPNLDAMKVMGYIYYKQSIQVQQLLLDICAPNKNEFTINKKTFIPQDLLKETWVYGRDLVDDNTGRGLTAEDYKGFSSVFYILKKIADLAGINSTPNSATRDNTYVCNPDIFDVNGRILPKKFSVDDNRIPNLESMIRQSQKEISKNLEIDKRRIITEEIQNEQLQNTLKEKQLLVDLYDNNKTMQGKRITELKLENKLLQDEVDTKGQYVNEETGRCKKIRQLKPCGEGQERNKKTNRCKKIERYCVS